MQISENFKKLRKILRLSQSEFAKEININSSIIKNIESDRAKASVELIIMICKKFEVNCWWLLTGEGEMFITAPFSVGSQAYAHKSNIITGNNNVILSHVDKDLVQRVFDTVYAVATANNMENVLVKRLSEIQAEFVQIEE